MTAKIADDDGTCHVALIVPMFEGIAHRACSDCVSYLSFPFFVVVCVLRSRVKSVKPFLEIKKKHLRSE